MPRKSFALGFFLVSFFCSFAQAGLDLGNVFYNLRANYVTCYYGTYNNPDLHEGCVDGRHTAFSSSSIDPNTNGLRTIPVGETHSVRLGNSNTGSQAESIEYRYTVDTSKFDLLVLKYAAVLEDPNHSATSQPRFALKILNSNRQEINPGCYSADFVAGNNTSGWSTYGRVVWKDWTPVGIDLDQFHGQTIIIKLTSYDCSLGAHFGYSYFTLRCDKKRISATSCGYTVENTFTAPSGFSYAWYKASNPSNILSRSQSLHVTQEGTYHCRMTMTGASSSSCAITMTCVAGFRFPYARGTYRLQSATSCTPQYRFTNQSVITTDEEHLQLTNQPCDGVKWYFGDGSYSTENNPVHTYAANGTYNVKLIATLSNGACADTMEFPIVVYSPCTRVDTIRESICAGDRYKFHGSWKTQAGTYKWDSAYYTEYLKLSVNQHSPRVNIHDTIVENQLPWNAVVGRVYSGSVENAVFHFLNQKGCDSTVGYGLYVYPNITRYYDTAVCSANLPLLWKGQSFAGSTLSTRTLVGRHGEDSTVTLNVDVKMETSSNTDTTVCDRLQWRCGGASYQITSSGTNTYHLTNAVGCDSSVVLNLTVNRSAITYTDSTVCDSVSWNGRMYAASGLYQFDTTTVHSCDSIARLRLVVNRSNTSMNEASVCDAYVWNSARYTESGLYNHHAKNRWGCDSIAYLNLDVRKSYRLTIDTTVCDSILWNGRNLKSDGNYFYRGSTWQGCDSLLMLTLRVHPSTVGYTSVSACDEYTWFGRTFTESCSPNHHSTNAHGCDSNTILFLTINHGTQSRITRAVCDSLYWKGEWRNVTSEYVFDTLNYNGCDSVVVLNLTVNRSSYDTVRTQQCDYFFWNGYPLFGSDTVSYRTRNSVGCDSLVTLYLTMNYATSSIDTLNSCHPVVWHGAQYSASNNSATYVVENSVGCDSVIRLNLTMPKPYKAAFVLTPDFVEPDNMHFRATDKSEGDLNWRQWSVDDEILPYSHSFEYNYPNHVDSMKVQLIVREKMFGCLDTAARWIPLKGGMPFAPNIFTPERSEQNRFMVYLSNVKTFDINIYTREGALVFHSSDINEHWDGTWMGKGRKCPQAVYTYIVRYTTDISDDIQVKKGTVLLAY